MYVKAVRGCMSGTHLSFSRCTETLLIHTSFIFFFLFSFFSNERKMHKTCAPINYVFFDWLSFLSNILDYKKERIEGFMIDKCSVHNSTATRPCTSDAYAHPYQSTPASQITSPYTLFVFIFFIIFFGA